MEAKISLYCYNFLGRAKVSLQTIELQEFFELKSLERVIQFPATCGSAKTHSFAGQKPEQTNNAKKTTIIENGFLRKLCRVSQKWLYNE